MFNRHSNIAGQGGLIEKEAFGSIEKSKYPNWEQYRPYQEAIDIVKESQPHDSEPSDPDARFANDLHATIAEKLGLENYDDLRFYTAVGSQLDRFHGVDAFFEIDDPESGKTETITLDITINKGKDQYKADIIITMPDEGLDPSLEEDKEEYCQKMQEVSEEVILEYENRKK